MRDMKFIIAPDKFKECLPATDVAAAIKKGVLDACPGSVVIEAPMADGGEGTVEAVVAAARGRYVETAVPDPLGRPVTARFGMFDNGRRAVIEMAAASGLDLLTPDERDPMKTSTRGTGVLIKNAVRAGARHIIVGMGGSATVDCGMGMAAELGVKFFDEKGEEIKKTGGAALEKVERIELSGIEKRLEDVKIVAACDVTNPLIGAEGAARVYAPQKGADPQMVARLEKAVEHFARVTGRETGVDISNLPGGGAAGGLAAGMVAFTGARIESGVETVIKATKLGAKMKGCDLVITGEGKADYQSAFGKTPAGVGDLAKKYDIPAVMVAGKLGEGYRQLYNHGISAAFCIADGPISKKEAFHRAPQLLRKTAESIALLFYAG